MSEIESQLSERRSAWAGLTPTQQMQRVQYALLDFQDHAIWRRQQTQRQLAQRLAAQPQKVREYEPL